MADFTIAAAQVPSIRGDLEANIETHAAAIEVAAGRGVAVLVFPEMSLTGYEPDLAAVMAMTPSDRRLAPLVALARGYEMEVVAGAPLQNGTARPALGAMVFTASGATRTYRKMHLGANEGTYFTAGSVPLLLAVSGQTLGIAICADTSHPTHPQTYVDLGAKIYAAGVFLNAEWYETDAPRFAAYAARHRILTVMANHGASSGTYTSVGKSAVWAPGGGLLAEAEGTESVLVLATRDDTAWRGAVVRI